MKGIKNLKSQLGQAGSIVPQLTDTEDRKRRQKLYNYRWQQARRRFLDKHPCCAECARKGFVSIANEVDHIVPHKGSEPAFWDESNWQALCKPCHSAKTLRGE